MGGPRQARRRQPDQRQALDGVNPDAGADRFEQARHDVDLNAEFVQSAEEIENLVVGGAREGDDHAVDAERLHDPRNFLGRTEDRQPVCGGLALARPTVDEAEDADAVFRVTEELPGDEFPDLARADDHRPLNVGLVAPAESSRRSARQRDENDGKRPEEGEAAQVRRRETAEPGAGKEQPRADRDEVEHTGQVVGCRVVRALLVSVVEPVDLRQDNPDGESQSEEQELALEGDSISGATERELRGEEGAGETEEIPKKERAPDEPATAFHAPAAAPPGGALVPAERDARRRVSDVRR
jgi:hypothetical protein